MRDYATPLPVDRNGNSMYNSPPPVLKIATSARDNASASSVTSLNANTTELQITAVTTGAGIAWATNQATSVITAGGTANFDLFIPEGQSMIVVVPRRVQGNSSSVAGLGVLEGLYSGTTGGIATKSSGVGSVLLVEY